MSSVYIHIPFCRKKCDYCDFYSLPHDSGKEDFYVDFLTKEIEREGARFSGRTFDTVFFGGGTPSVLSEKNFIRLTEALRRHFCIGSGAEITIEGNPSDFAEAGRAEFFKKHGVNRVSVGIQTMSDKTLALIGRAQTAVQNLRALEALTKNFENVNADVMLALPNETVKDIEATVNTLIRFGIKHVSAYALTVEANTPIKRKIDGGEIVPADGDFAADAYDFVKETLERHGIERYEISNFAVRGYECRHNLNYWRRGEYVGLGAAAHSFVKETTEKYSGGSNIETVESGAAVASCGVRYENPRSIDAYCSAVREGVSPAKNIERLDAKTALFEKIMLGFRLTEGLNIAELDGEFQTDFLKKYGAVFTKYEKCFQKNDGRIRIRDEYFYCMNTLLAEFLED
jgi:oxygen-independent coproporphyrinogen-3 oxidase